MAAKSNGTRKMIFQNLLIKILWHLIEFFFYCMLSNENFKMEVEQTNISCHI